MMPVMPISKTEAEAFLNRWSMVRDAERDQLQSASLEIKAKQLAALMESRSLFGENMTREHEVAVVRARWARLREILGG
jgi:hypothetical protein